jgi:membrane protease subunit (stomatin/prohibitin family)
MDAIAKMRNAQAEKTVFGILGEDWGRQQAANILGTVAANPGAGGVASAGAGLGMGLAAGGAFGGMAQQMFAPMQQQQPAPPTQNAVADDPVATLKKLKDMLDLGLIEQSDLDAKKTEIMNRM